MDPLPYNVTISSQAASLDYFPARDTTIDAGWNVTYSDGIQNIRYGPQGKGTACRQTSLLGARITFNWVGTAVYLYGNATSGSYKIRVDGSDITDLPSGQGGVLGVKTGMPYSNHSVVLIALGGGRVSFWYAEVTIGAGYPGSPASTTTIPVVLENSDKTSFMANAFFTYSPVITSIEDTTTGWYVDSVVRSTLERDNTLHELVPSREMSTNTNEAKIIFSVNQTSTFFLWGCVNRDHGAKTATLTSISGDYSKSTAINDLSSILDFQQIIYWESGLDREQTYLVSISVDRDDAPNYLSVATLDLVDSGPKPSPPTSPSLPSGSAKPGPAERGGGNAGLGNVAIAGIAVGSANGITLIVLLALWFWRRKRRPIDITRGRLVAQSYTSTSLMREIDESPAEMLPPEYDDGWSSSSLGVISSPRHALPVPYSKGRYPR